MVLKAFGKAKPSSFYNPVILLGWLIRLAITPLVKMTALQGLLLLVLGGVLDTSGALLYAFDSRILYRHLIWH